MAHNSQLSGCCRLISLHPRLEAVENYYHSDISVVGYCLRLVSADFQGGLKNDVLIVDEVISPKAKKLQHTVYRSQEKLIILESSYSIYVGDVVVEMHYAW